MFPLKNLAPKEKLGFITWALILINVAVFVFTWQEVNNPTYLLDFGLVPIKIGMPNYVVPFFEKVYPFITYQFIHSGILHIILNIYFLYIFGGVVESRIGHKNFLIVYIVFGVIAGTTQVFASISSGIPIVGASGAVAGIMGVALILYPKSEIKTLFVLIIFLFVKSIPAVVFIGLWFILQLILLKFTLVVDDIGVAVYAHIGGFIAGVIFGLAFRVKERYNLR